MLTIKNKLLLLPLLLIATGESLASEASLENTTVNFLNKQSQQLNTEKINTSINSHQNSLPAPEDYLIEPSRQMLLTTPGVVAHNEVSTKSDQNTTRAHGSFSVPYRSGRVSHYSTNRVSSGSQAYLSATYPYSAIGRLTFTDSSGDSFLCSASLIRKSVIVTAAHCIQDFGGGNISNDNFVFTPASFNGSAPYGQWDWKHIIWPGSWANGTDKGVGATRQNDIALILLEKNSDNKFAGQLTGYLSYGWNNYSFVRSRRTGGLYTAALTTLGYPGLIDSGRIMQRTDGPAYLATVSGVGQIYQGSNFTGGSSGGPWVANFRARSPAYSSGSNAGWKSVPNIVVGVTSWGAADPNRVKNNYSSQFRQNSRYPKASYGSYGGGNIGSLMNTLCTKKPSGSSSTYKQLGYCD